jgi:hypothetical protein
MAALVLGSNHNDGLFALVWLAAIVAIVAASIYGWRRRLDTTATARAAQRSSVLDWATQQVDADPASSASTLSSHAKRRIETTKSDGTKSERWQPCVLAMNRSQLVIFDINSATVPIERLRSSGRETIHAVDIVSTAMRHDRFCVTLTSGDESQFKPNKLPFEDYGELDDFERSARALVTGAKGTNSSQPESIAEELAKLAELRDQGVIDSDDWDRAKDLYLGKTEDERDRAARELRQIHDLCRSGVLSESEFNMKKWEILSRTR